MFREALDLGLRELAESSRRWRTKWGPFRTAIQARSPGFVANRWMIERGLGHVHRWA